MFFYGKSSSFIFWIPQKHHTYIWSSKFCVLFTDGYDKAPPGELPYSSDPYAAGPGIGFTYSDPTMPPSGPQGYAPGKLFSFTVLIVNEQCHDKAPPGELPYSSDPYAAGQGIGFTYSDPSMPPSGPQGYAPSKLFSSLF